VAAAIRLLGTVERTVFHNSGTRYTVLRLKVPGRATLVTAVGRSDGAEDGAEVELTGAWTTHAAHGEQFAFELLQLQMPTTEAGILRRLKRYPGVGDAAAERIVRRFGGDALDIVDRDPRRLLEVEGIGPKTLERILEFHRAHHGPIAAVETALLQLDVPVTHARAIVERYGEEALSVLRNRPFRLAREVRGIGFTTADRIARAVGIAADADERVDAGLLHTLEQAESEGHCGLPVTRLLEGGGRLLQLGAEPLREGLRRLLRLADAVEEVIDGQALVFRHRLVVAERNVATALARLAMEPREPWRLPPLPEHLAPEQRDAVAAIAARGLVVLTGGPGTGKSTVVRQVIEAAEHNEVEVLLAAPTGRAAKRLEQTTGREAKTIHRLLEIQGDTGRFTFGRDQPLPAGLVVIDESSMVDIGLAQALLAALGPEHRLLLVGDADQLPSVGPGNVLRDVIAAAEQDPEAIALVRLTRIFRQAEGSSIVENAHRILGGELPVADGAGDGGEFFVIAARDAEHAHELVMKIVTERAPQAYGLDARSEVQILAPMHRGRAGTEALNRALQEFHTDGRAEVVLGSGPTARRFRSGDRVMQTRNDYERNVFNGDIGVVAQVDVDRGRIVVNVDGALVPYEAKDLTQLQLAYAITIHKSQGSEFPAVVVPLLGEHHVMLRRNLLYTAVTRAKRLCVIVGDRKALLRAVLRGDAAERFTGLTLRVRRALRGEADDWAIVPLALEEGPA
jgi:exodeoxyribonuclease V alpha subunit